MNFYESIGYECKASEWAEMVQKVYERYGVNVELKCLKMFEERFIYEVKLKKQTRIKHVFDKQEDVKMRSKFPLFILGKADGIIYLVLSDKTIDYPHLTEFLNQKDSRKIPEGMKLPYFVGFDITSSIILIDLAKQPHILLGGSTRSGKTVGLKSLVSSICYWKSPTDVNVVLVDLGANDLSVFNGLPHLSCPVVNERTQAYCVLRELDKEMKHRKELETSDRMTYEQLPSIVVIIDEFPDLFSIDLGKKIKREGIEIISNLLRRGRHFNIHVVLAAQNPTMQNMKVDLGNITTRMAFKCAKKNFSEVILGEAGAENLMGKGELLLKSSEFDIPIRIQGVNITDEELSNIARKIRSAWKNIYSNPHKFRPSLENKLKLVGYEEIPRDDEFEEKLFARVLVWVVSQEKLSCNLLQKTFGIGWNRADAMMEKLQTMEIIESLDAKLPRTVLIRKKEDISEDIMKKWLQLGVSKDLIAEVFLIKNTQ